MSTRTTDLVTEAVDIDSLTPDPQNARKHDKRNLDAIAESLTQFGQRRPLVVTHAGVVIAGNGTLEAARSLGWKRISVTRTPKSWSVDKAKAYALADNKTAELAAWDDTLLAGQLVELDAAGWDTAALGFDIETSDQDDDIIEPDPVPLSNVPVKTVVGDVWILGSHRVMCGSATSTTDLDKLVAGNPVGLVLTDPPYGISVVKGGMVGADFGVAKKGKYIPVAGDDSTDAAIEAYHLVKQYSDRVILWGGNYYAEALPPSSCWLVWDKRGDTGIENTFADAELAWTSLTGPVRIYRQLWNGMIREGERGERYHPTQKPVALAKWCVERYADTGAVLDVFAGSGFSLFGAHEADRVAYLMELEPRYVDAICARWQKATGIKPIAEATGREHDFLEGVDG